MKKLLSLKRLGLSALAFGAIALTSVGLSSCTSDFDAINTNPTQPVNIDPMFLLANNQLRIAGDNFEQQTWNYTGLCLVVQHTAPTGEFGADMYQSLPSATFELMYSGRPAIGQTGIVRQIQDMIELSKNDPRYANLTAMARILRVFVFHRLTDLFGDIPYTEASRGFYDRNFTPKYDNQQDIYRDMLKELREASAQFSTTALAVGTRDVMFQGNIDRWRRFAQSLRLRLAMRLVNVDPATARSEAEAAIAAGVMQSNADRAWLDHANNIRVVQSPIAQGIALQIALYRYSSTFINQLRTTNDPRMRIFIDPGFTNNNNPIGVPNGLTSAQRTAQGVNNAAAARPSQIIASRDFNSPSMIMTYAEVEFLQAEAKLRGWATPKTANQHYLDGITAAMGNYAAPVYPNPTNVAMPTAAEITAFTAQASIALTGTFDQQLERIITQKWIVLLFDGFEPFSEFRRTGYPRLAVLNPVGNITNGQFPRRALYPTSELNTNPDNVNASILRAGANYPSLTARVWWDTRP